VSGESDAVAWMRPAAAIEAVREGRLAMMPPTQRTCAELAALPRAGGVLAAAAGRRISMVQPRLVVDGDQVWLETAAGTGTETGTGTGTETATGTGSGPGRARP
jgi:hypothetical protein